MSGASPIRLWVRTHPGLVLLLVAPVVVFLAPEVVGRAFLSGDNLIQNFPLRVLVARNLQAGDLPLLNPYIYGGAPLLAGFNAGAAYPTTWLIAVLPQFLAWGLNLAIAYDVGVLGMYLFLRRQPLDRTAATLGAALYAFTGYLAGQIVHIDLILGAGWLPWALLGIHELTRTRPAGAPGRAGLATSLADRIPWILVLGAAVGLSLLSGGAEAFIDGAELMALYALWRLVGLVRRAREAPAAGSPLGSLTAPLIGLALAVGTGLGLGAAQWIPGLVFQSSSQRGQATYGFFTSGSLNYHLLDLLISPFAQGSNQGFATFVGQYNFPEVVSYVGIFPLIAVLVLPTRRWRHRIPGPEWFWYGIVALGVLSALGFQTPFAHLLYLVPGVNRQRLLNRNLLLVDLSLVVLAARWMHLVLRGAGRRLDTAPPETAALAPGPPDPAVDRPGPALDRPGRLEVVLTCLPAALIVLTALTLWVDGVWVLARLDVAQIPTFGQRMGIAALATAGAAVACFGTWVALTAARREHRRRRRLVIAVVTCDIVVFLVGAISGTTSQTTATAAGPQARALATATGDGRFLIYDPDILHQQRLIALGQTDLNVFNRLASAQGYAALVDGTYADRTGAHLQETLAPATLGGATWDDLNARVLLSLPGYFLTPAPGAGGPGTTAQPAPAPTRSTVTFPADLRSYVGAPLRTTTPSHVAAGGIRQWYLGGPLTVGAWDVPVLGGGGVPDLQAGLLDRSGRIRWLPTARVRTVRGPTGTTLEVRAGGTVATGLVVRDAGGRAVVLGVPTATTAEAGRVALDGRLQVGVTAPHWRYTGTIDGFGVFANTRTRGWAWATGPGGRGTPPPATTVEAGAPPQNGVQHITVRTRGPATLVRSMTYAASWRATLARAGSPARAVSIGRAGVVQRVAIPAAGTWVVTFRYASPSALWGVAISAVSLAVVMVVAALAYRRRRRRSSRSGASGASGGSGGPGGRGRGDGDGQAGSRPMAAAARS